MIKNLIAIKQNSRRNAAQTFSSLSITPHIRH